MTDQWFKFWTEQSDFSEKYWLELEARDPLAFRKLWEQEWPPCGEPDCEACKRK